MFNIGDRVRLCKTTFFGTHFVESGTKGTIIDVGACGVSVTFDSIDNIYSVVFDEITKIEE